nr:adenylosuccinate lyase family protein [Allostreptomyces psammosilenae]
MLSPVSVDSAARAATGDTAFLQAMLDAEAALTRAQAALGQAPADAAAVVTAAARADHYDVRDLARRARAGGNPVIPLVAELTAAVAERDPAAAPFVHRGATSQDILDTAAMLVAARTLRIVVADLERTAEALGRLARGHRETALPGRTLTQHAVPTTFGLKAAGWRDLVLDALDRLDALLHGGLPAQLGGAAGTLAAFHAHAAHAARDAADAPDTAARADTAGRGEGDGGVTGWGEGDCGLALLAGYAGELGLAEPRLPWHTLRTPVADLGSALAFTTGALGKLAADVLLLSRTEIGEVAEGSGGGSSAMPHKSNPVRATLIAAAARQAPAHAAVLLGALAAEDERPAGAWHAEWEALRQLLRLAGGAARDAAELVTGLRVFPHRMREHLDLTGGAVVSERIAAVLGPLLGRGPAKRVLGAATRRAAAEGRTLSEVLAEDPELAGHLTRERLRELVDPTGYLGSATALTDRALRRPTRPRPPAGGPARHPDARDGSADVAEPRGGRSDHGR